MGNAKSVSHKQSQHLDLKCGDVHPRQTHAQWHRASTQDKSAQRKARQKALITNNHMVISSCLHSCCRDGRRKIATYKSSSPDLKKLECEVLHPTTAHRQWWLNHRANVYSHRPLHEKNADTVKRMKTVATAALTLAFGLIVAYFVVLAVVAIFDPNPRVDPSADIFDFERLPSERFVP